MNVNNMQWMLLNYKLNYRIVCLALVWQDWHLPLCSLFVSICEYSGLQVSPLSFSV